MANQQHPSLRRSQTDPARIGHVYNPSNSRVPSNRAPLTAADSRVTAIRAIHDQTKADQERIRKEEQAKEAQRHLSKLLLTITALDLIRAKIGAGTGKQSEQIRKHPGFKAFRGEGLPDGMDLKKVDATLRMAELRNGLGPGVGQWSWETFAREMNQPSNEGVRKFRDACMSSKK